MIRLGVNTWLWANRFEEKHLFCIDRAKELGAEAVDFSVNDPYSFPVGAAAAKMEGTGMASIVTTAMAGHCNAISPEAPVHVRIHSDGSFLEVENDLVPKASPPVSSGLGLKYIRQQYLDLSRQEIHAGSDGKSFRVRIRHQAHWLLLFLSRELI